MALTYPKMYEDDINLEIQNTDITNLKDINQQDLNRFLLYYIVYYKDSKYNNTILWYCIREDFIRQKDFRNFLQEYRVFISIDEGTIKDNIQEQVINVKKRARIDSIRD